MDIAMTEKPFTIASLNVRGLRNSTHKLKQIKAWLASLSPPPQVILIGKEGIKSIGNGIKFWQGISFWNEGIPMGTSQRLSVGTAILVDKTIALLVKDHGTLSEGRAQYITLQSPNRGTLTVINIYAPELLQRSSSPLEETLPSRTGFRPLHRWGRLQPR